MLVYTHPECLLKDNGFNHPERKERLETIIDSIKQIKDLKINFVDAPLADIQIVSLVHPIKHVEEIFSNIPKSGLIGVEKNLMLILYFVQIVKMLSLDLVEPA